MLSRVPAGELMDSPRRAPVRRTAEVLYSDTSWQLYAMVATGALGMFLVQSALNAGRLIAAQPGLTLSDPIISILWGVLAFHEKVRGGLFPLLFASLSTLLLAGAVFALARSPLLSEEGQQEGSPRPGRRSPDKPAHATG